MCGRSVILLQVEHLHALLSMVTLDRFKTTPYFKFKYDSHSLIQSLTTLIQCRFTEANDAQVKKYLADRLSQCEAKLSETQSSLGSAEDELEARAAEAAELQEQVRALKADATQRLSEQRCAINSLFVES